MKFTLQFLFVIAISVCIFSCSKNETVQDGFLRGMYEMGNRTQEMEHGDNPIQPDKETPTYDQYKRERQETLNGQESHQS